MLFVSFAASVSLFALVAAVVFALFWVGVAMVFLVPTLFRMFTSLAARGHGAKFLESTVTSPSWNGVASAGRAAATAAAIDPLGSSWERSKSSRAMGSGPPIAVSSTSGVEPGLPLGHLEDALTVRVGADGTADATEGPYVNAEGAVGGYFVFDAASKEEAIALAARVPAARMGGAVEVRPAQAYW